LHDLRERRLYRLRALQGRPEEAAALADPRNAHPARQYREDDLLRGRPARVRRLPDVLLALPVDARPDGEAQERLARAKAELCERLRLWLFAKLLLGARAGLRRDAHPDADHQAGPSDA